MYSVYSVLYKVREVYDRSRLRVWWRASWIKRTFPFWLTQVCVQRVYSVYSVYSVQCVQCTVLFDAGHLPGPTCGQGEGRKERPVRDSLYLSLSHTVSHI